MAMTGIEFALQWAKQDCHNCRKGRRKCDRTLPGCSKCIQRNQDCLGYGQLLRWQQASTSPTTTPENSSPSSSESLSPEQRVIAWESEPTIPQRTGPILGDLVRLHNLTDPLLQDLGPVTRGYLFYFASHVCKDLVVYDVAHHNPYRTLIPMTHKHPILLQTMIANSALRMANASLTHMNSSTTSFDRSAIVQDVISRSYQGSVHGQRARYVGDALLAKHQALCQLQRNLTDLTTVDVDVTLAAVLLLVEFELLDTGRDNWRYHVDGAKSIILKICGAELSLDETVTPLRRWLISNCLIYDILGSAISNRNHPSIHHEFDSMSANTQSLLCDAEGNHCSSFPAMLLTLVQAGSRLLQASLQVSTKGAESCVGKEQAHRATALLSAAWEFDPVLWATQLQSRSPRTDLEHRVQIGCALRAGCLIYLSRVVLETDPMARLPESLDNLVNDILSHLTFIDADVALFTATAWPAFIAGAESRDAEVRAWVERRVRFLWAVEPWGTTQCALEILRKLWARHPSHHQTCLDHDVCLENLGGRDPWRNGGAWIVELRQMGIDWLIW